MQTRQIKKISDTVWEIPRTFSEGMRVPARIIATEALLSQMEEAVFTQITNVAKLPGILKHALCMPDGHWGYGFPIGGVAAMDLEKGVISPGGIGFDINCGMRLMTTHLTEAEVQPRLKQLVDRLYNTIPSGVGRGGRKLRDKEFKRLIEQGADWCVANGYGWKEDLERTEEQGRMKGARADAVSHAAIQRGRQQVGTLGSGNHYLEIQVVKENNIMDKELAARLGVNQPGQVVVMFHCGSRGFGHQVATDYLQTFLKVMQKKYQLPVHDRQLSCAPFRSEEGQAYFAAMQCAVNMAFANRQMILHHIREAFSRVFNQSPQALGLHQVYDVAHNIAKVESMEIDGQTKKVLVHRKGATRALAPGMAGLPPVYQKTGQPVIIGGSMETGSYLLVGQEGSRETFYSTAHGSGRVMSRKAARKRFHGQTLLKALEDKGIYVNAASLSGLAEEAGGAYKNIDDITGATEQAGISKRVVRFVPIGNIKG
jgi:tRNA-splicing ligase RtcB